MDIEPVFSQCLCTYKDEAKGASAVPLTVLGVDYKAKTSSHYFANEGIEIGLQTSANGEILKIQLGPAMQIDFSTMKAGIEIGPFGLLPVHVLQFDSSFNSRTGGELRFGFLKRIISKRSFFFMAKRLWSRVAVFTGVASTSSWEENLSDACEKHFGSKNWGTFDIVIKRLENGEWAVYQKGEASLEKSIEKLVAKFNVNKSGVVLGIDEMYSL